MRLPEIRTIPVADIEIPVELSRLYDLAYNLWWTWEPRAQHLFSSIDPERWAHDPNPVELLINVEPHRWEDLLQNDSFLATYHGVVQEFDRYLDGVESSWFRRTFPDYDDGPIVYGSTEYGWHESLRVYSGGLGILSGDHAKAASDLGVPFIGIGLLYRRGYFRQSIDADGNQQHSYPDYDLRRLPLLPVTHPNGRRVLLNVQLKDRSVQLRLWKANVGRVPVILLDTNLRENDPADRPITSMLYVRGREMRLCQEILLGLGGVQAIRALGIRPARWHMNEGHSAFIGLELLRETVATAGVDFDEAVKRVRTTSVFTTHTPVPAGNEVFEEDLIRDYLEPTAAAIGVEPERLIELGRSHPDAAGFNLTALAIRLSGHTNGVSRLHGEVASGMWRHLFDESAEPPIRAVTNGVHLSTWLGPEMRSLLRRQMGSACEPAMLEALSPFDLADCPDQELWSTHLAQKQRLLLSARHQLLEQFARHGRSPGELRRVAELLDPEALTIGFARRFATYKRAALLFRDNERLRSILAADGRPVQIIFAGKAHPADRPGQELIRSIFQASLSPEFHGHVVFLEDYSMALARCLVQGVDLWLNTPRRPHEASGTSGMKAAINGVLNMSVLDGWWCEGYDPTHGWTIGSPKDYDDTEAQDHEDAESLYSTLANEVVPAFYDRDPESGLPTRWIARMKASIGSLTAPFSAARMVREYTERYYVSGAKIKA